MEDNRLPKQLLYCELPYALPTDWASKTAFSGRIKKVTKTHLI